MNTLRSLNTRLLAALFIALFYSTSAFAQADDEVQEYEFTEEELQHMEEHEAHPDHEGHDEHEGHGDEDKHEDHEDHSDHSGHDH